MENLAVSELKSMDSSGRLTHSKSGRYLTRRASPGNKKVLNARKNQFDGYFFDSKIERDMYCLLKQNRVDFTQKEKFLLQGSFKDRSGALIREISWRPDFVIENQKIVIETKGFPNDVFPVKLKLFKKHYPEYTVWIIRQKKQFPAVLHCLHALLDGSREFQIERTFKI